MKVIKTEIPEVLLLEPRVFEDARGVLSKATTGAPSSEATGLDPEFVQDNRSALAQQRAARAALPGATAAGQADQRAARRDLRRRGRSAAQLADVRQMGRLHAVGERSAHGVDPARLRARLPRAFRARPRCSTSSTTSGRRAHERTIAWNDADIGVRWPLQGEPIVSDKDRRGTRLPIGRTVRLRILLTGRNGQVGWELERALPALGELIATDRADAGPGRPGRDPARACARSKPDVIVNAAAYTAVDKRGNRARRWRSQVNAVAPGVLAEEAKRLGALLVHYSTDYVFDGEKRAPYLEARRAESAQPLRAQQARGRARRRRQRLPAPDPAHELGLRAARGELLPDHPAQGAGQRADADGRRPDQRADAQRVPRFAHDGVY